MSIIEITEDTFTCHQEEDIAVFQIFLSAKTFIRVSGKELLWETLNAIKADQDIKGVVCLYPETHRGDAEHIKVMKELIENVQQVNFRKYSDIFKNVIIQFLEQIYTFPKPIVGGMDGYIAPVSFAANLAFDLQIATENASIILPDLKFGLPPSPPLAFYLLHNLGPLQATNLILTKSEITAQEAFDLGLLTQVVSKEDLKDSCINKLRELAAISSDALIESRRLLKPSLKEMREYMDEGFEGLIRCINKMKKSS